MILDLILDNNVDTYQLIFDLKQIKAEHIAVLDYDFVGDYKILEGVIYISTLYAIEYIEKFDSVNYYKSLYVYPGLNGSMYSFFKK